MTFRLRRLTPSSGWYSAHMFVCCAACLIRYAVQLSDQPNLQFCRPDGKKKAYVKLTPDYDALDVANKIGII
uniref:50S ribosomal protein L23, chloroplastic n=1 Tax=Aegilops tauschii subsp. strangulata TaxID=200361 RepID=A0A453CBZ5_AEGTS